MAKLIHQFLLHKDYLENYLLKFKFGMLHYCILLAEMLQLTFYYKGKEVFKAINLSHIERKKIKNLGSIKKPFFFSLKCNAIGRQISSLFRIKYFSTCWRKNFLCIKLR